MVSLGGEGGEELMAVALAKNGPLSIALNAKGMEYYIHGLFSTRSVFLLVIEGRHVHAVAVGSNPNDSCRLVAKRVL